MESVERLLPNGFHDGVLLRLSVDYELGRLSLDVDFWVSNADDEESESYRCGRVTISGLEFLVVDKPNSLVGSNTHLIIDGGPGQPSTSPLSLPPVGAGSFLYWLFVNEWNSFIRFAGRDAVLEWTGEAVQKP